jgi:hypothetical protein
MDILITMDAVLIIRYRFLNLSEDLVDVGLICL